LKTVLKKDTAVSVFIFHPYQRLKRQLRLKIGRASLTLPLWSQTFFCNVQVI